MSNTVQHHLIRFDPCFAIILDQRSLYLTFIGHLFYININNVFYFIFVYV